MIGGKYMKLTKLDKTRLLKNGARLLGQKKYREADPHIRSIIAHFNVANEPFVSWAYNFEDNGCFWGHYHIRLDNAFNHFFKRGDVIDMTAYRWIELHATQQGEICSLKDEFDSFTFFGIRFKDCNREYLADLFSIEVAIEFSHWLKKEYGITVLNNILISA